MRPARSTTFGLVLLVATLACRGEPRETDADKNLAHLVDSLMPAVEQSVGVKFKRRPEAVLRTRDEVRSFVRAKLAQEMPPERFLQLTRAYTLLGLLPDSLDLRAVMEDMLSQQIAGYYDPDSATFYGVVGADQAMQRLTIAHELVHALQEFLGSLAPIQAHAVVILDEAQHVQPDVLEQIRLVSNIQDDGGTLLQIMLVGQPGLNDLLARPELRQLTQRVSRVVRLDPLSGPEVARYIRHRLSVAREPSKASALPGASDLERELAAWDNSQPDAPFTPEAAAQSRRE